MLSHYDNLMSLVGAGYVSTGEEMYLDEHLFMNYWFSWFWSITEVGLDLFRFQYMLTYKRHDQGSFYVHTYLNVFEYPSKLRQVEKSPFKWLFSSA